MWWREAYLIIQWSILYWRCSCHLEVLAHKWPIIRLFRDHIGRQKLNGTSWKKSENTSGILGTTESLIAHLLFCLFFRKAMRKQTRNFLRNESARINIFPRWNAAPMSVFITWLNLEYHASLNALVILILIVDCSLVPILRTCWWFQRILEYFVSPCTKWSELLLAWITD